MLVIKGLLIFSPFFLFRLQFLELIKQKIVALSFIVFSLIIAISPLSFIGWFVDYLLFFIVTTIALHTLTKNWTTMGLMITRFLALLILCGYLAVNSLFGPELTEKYKKDDLIFQLYRIPDMVLSDTYRLRIDQPWGPFEKTVFDGQVQWNKCTTFDFNLAIKKLFTRNKCNED